MELLHTLWQLIVQVWDLLRTGLYWWLPIVWVAWWLFAVDWRRAWQWLAQGAWVPVVLLTLMAALVWSRLDPQPVDLQFMTLANFWWQLGAVALIVAVTLLCGWVQGLLRWYPPEIDLEPPAAEHAPGHHH